MADSGSVTVQLTCTLLVYHPLAPSVPLTLGVMTGGVESGGGLTVKVVPLPLAICPEEQAPALLPLQATNVHVPVELGVNVSVWVELLAALETRMSRRGTLTEGTKPGAYHWMR